MRKKDCDSADVLKKQLRAGGVAQGRESAYHVQGPEFDAQHHRKGEKQNVGVHTSERMSTHPSHTESFPSACLCHS